MSSVQCDPEAVRAMLRQCHALSSTLLERREKLITLFVMEILPRWQDARAKQFQDEQLMPGLDAVRRAAEQLEGHCQAMEDRLKPLDDYLSRGARPAMQTTAVSASSAVQPSGIANRETLSSPSRSSELREPPAPWLPKNRR